jgi:hypothetical protein
MRLSTALLLLIESLHRNIRQSRFERVRLTTTNSCFELREGGKLTSLHVLDLFRGGLLPSRDCPLEAMQGKRPLRYMVAAG